MSNTQMIFRRYLRKTHRSINVKNESLEIHHHPVGVVAAQFDGSNTARVNFGFALTHKDDNFVRKTANKMCLERLASGEMFVGDITNKEQITAALTHVPHRLKNTLNYLLNDMSVKYYKRNSLGPKILNLYKKIVNASKGH